MTNDLHKLFQNKYSEFKNHFFDRDPDIWPIYRDPMVKDIVLSRIKSFRNSEFDKNVREQDVLKKMFNKNKIPQKIASINDGEQRDLLKSVASLTKIWEDPASVENVVCASADPGIYGVLMGIIANANLVYKEYCGLAEELETVVSNMMSSLVGYNVNDSCGLFTAGGTFCNLYGYLLGIRKNLPEARTFGMGYIHDYRMINSQGGHYSNTTNLSLLGVNIKEKTIRIRVNKNNDIDLSDFELQLESCFRLNCVVPTIMLTMGTTDTFAVDDIEGIYEIREKLCNKFEIKNKPHLHIDSAVGWPMVFFLDYNFDGNPLHINEETLIGIKKHQKKFEKLKYADSCTIDFHKWGYVPLLSSMLLIKNKKDLEYLENDPDNFQYFDKATQGKDTLHYTIECSRSATGVFGAYANLTHFGVEGYQLILAHCLQNANYFRNKLKEFSYIKVIAASNQGPSVGFRVYNPELVKNAVDEFEFEYNAQNSDEYDKRIKSNSEFHRKLFLEKGKEGLYTNWVESISHTSCDEQNHYKDIPGEKAVFMNPYTTRKEIDSFIDNLVSNLQL